MNGVIERSHETNKRRAKTFIVVTYRYVSLLLRA